MYIMKGLQSYGAGQACLKSHLVQRQVLERRYLNLSLLPPANAVTECAVISGSLLLSENTTRVGKCTYSVRHTCILMATNSIANTKEKVYLVEKS